MTWNQRRKKPDHPKPPVPGQKLSNDEYLVLAQMNDLSDGRLAGILARNRAHDLTICPICYFDGFLHREDCAIRQALERRASIATAVDPLLLEEIAQVIDPVRVSVGDLIRESLEEEGSEQ